MTLATQTIRPQQFHQSRRRMLQSGDLINDWHCHPAAFLAEQVRAVMGLHAE
ncbi:MAG: hypothetical protein V4819_06305 [Verrucomicrobiota bacterium]